MTKVLHRQIYRPGPFGGEVNTTLCGRVRNGQDYNVAEMDESVTCSYCQRIISERGDPDKEAIAFAKGARSGWMRSCVFYKDIDAEGDPEVIAEMERRWPLPASAQPSRDSDNV